jgi:hypothetical protein
MDKQGYKLCRTDRLQYTQNLTDQISADEFRGTIQVQLRRPVYNTTYNTTMLNFVDNSFQFRYSNFSLSSLILPFTGQTLCRCWLIMHTSSSALTPIPSHLRVEMNLPGGGEYSDKCTECPKPDVNLTRLKKRNRYSCEKYS